MLTTEEIKEQLDNTLERTNFGIGKKYQGKVRDNYTLEGKRIIVTTDRISAFDHVLGTIPFKGQVLNQIAAFWFDKTKDIVKNHIIDIPDPNVMVVKQCKPLMVEMIVRGYLTGSLWRDYEKGKRDMYGIRFEDEMVKNEKFADPLVTPTTKEEHGKHDMPISKDELIEKGIVSAELWDKLEDISLRLFQRGTEVSKENNLILVDTKYEFGLIGDEVVLIDEVHTPDSSRFWFAHSYPQLFNQRKGPKQLDKEYVRQWLISERNYIGEGKPPELTDDVKIEAARRYIEVYEQITDRELRVSDEPVKERMERNLKEKGYL